MISLRRRALLAAVALTLGALTLGGCMNTPGPQAADAERASAEQGEQITESMPAFVRAAGWESIDTLSEESCNDSTDPEQASSTTRWFAASGRRGITEEEARSITEGVRKHAESSGWSTQDPPGGPQLLYAASQGDLNLVVRHSTTSREGPLTVEISTPCMDMPNGHTMTRSELDPMYGSGDEFYPGEDSSKFTNGEPKPLPRPSDASPATRSASD